jgi:hypothetical protein
MRIYTVREILEELDTCIKNKKPFSLIRFGDGGIKFLKSIIYNVDHSRLFEILKKEGIPFNKVYSIFHLWGKFATEANFIDSPEIYFTDKFWSRFTEQKRNRILPDIKNWNRIYYNADFDNDRYCNPEVNFLMLIQRSDCPNLIDIIKNKKIRCITDHEKVNSCLSTVCNSSTLRISGWFQNQYINNYRDVTKEIKRDAKKYDLWLVGAGELGRVYTGLIKKHGGRAIDMGSVFDCWVKDELPVRLKGYITRLSTKDLRFRFTNISKKYMKYI